MLGERNGRAHNRQFVHKLDIEAIKNFKPKINLLAAIEEKDISMEIQKR